MHYLLCRHKVADFAKWKRVFDSHAAGLKVKEVLRNSADSNEVFIWFEVTDLDKAREFVSSPAVPEAMQQSGVLDKPDVYFLSR